MSNAARIFLGQRRRAYQLALAGEAGKAVLADLAKFCRARETAFHTDPRTHALLEGRREVWLRIAHHLNLTEDELWKIYG